MHLWKNTVFVFLPCIMFTSAKQDDPQQTIPPQPMLQQLRLRWNFQKDIDHGFTSDIHIRDKSFGMPGEDVDFKSVGKAVLT